MRLFIILLLSSFVYADNSDFARLNEKEPVFSQLKTLLVYDNYDDFMVDKKTNESGVFLNFKEPYLLYLLNCFLDESINDDFLEKLREKTLAYYKDKGFALTAVVIPANQDVTDGTLKMVIFKGKLGAISAEGARYYSNEKVVKSLNIKPGEEIQTAHLEDTIAWLNRDPFRTVDLIYKKGEDLGDTDILLRVTDKFPFKAYCGYDNNHYPIVGHSRWTTGVQLGNMWGLDHHLNAQGVFASDIDRFWIFSGNYVVPLKWRALFKLFGNYSVAKPNNEDNLALPKNSNLTGRSWQVGFRYHHLVRSFKKWQHEIIIGPDFRRTNNFLYYGKNLIYNRFIDVSQLLLRYEGHYGSEELKIDLGLSLILSPGGIGAYNDNKSFHQERSGADCCYSYQIFNFDLIGPFFFKCSWAVSGMAQFSSTKLMPTEELLLGGHLSVRGFNENEVIGDKGILIRSELRSPTFSPFIRKWSSGLVFLGFIDFGATGTADKNLISQSSAILVSIGPGVRYNIEDHLSFKFDYGFQLKTPHGVLFGSNRHSEAHLAFYIGF